MTKWLKHEDDGYIFRWTEDRAKHPKLYEVSEEVAFPEKYKPKHLNAPKKRRQRKKVEEQLELFVSDLQDEPEYTNEELNAEASRNLPG